MHLKDEGAPRFRLTPLRRRGTPAGSGDFGTSEVGPRDSGPVPLPARRSEDESEGRGRAETATRQRGQVRDREKECVIVGGSRDVWEGGSARAGVDAEAPAGAPERGVERPREPRRAAAGSVPPPSKSAQGLWSAPSAGRRCAQFFARPPCGVEADRERRAIWPSKEAGREGGPAPPAPRAWARFLARQSEADVHLLRSEIVRRQVGCVPDVGPFRTGQTQVYPFYPVFIETPHMSPSARVWN